MCVRYTLHRDDAAINAIAVALARKLTLPEWVKPRYNVTLTHLMPVVSTGKAGPEVRGMTWGLIPFYERQKESMRMLPNAKAETAATLTAFKSAVAHRRCLVPANGFYEWKKEGTRKLPYLFTLKDEEPFAFAGIWERSADSIPETFCVLTTEPNEMVGRIHNRMPVILTGAMMARWIGSEPLPETEYRELTRPLPPELMDQRRVGLFVNNNRNEGPQCLEPPEDPPPELPLGITGA